MIWIGDERHHEYPLDWRSLATLNEGMLYLEHRSRIGLRSGLLGREGREQSRVSYVLIIYTKRISIKSTNHWNLIQYIHELPR